MGMSHPFPAQVGAAARLRPGAIMEIYKMYGDHLYKKCDWTGAVEQYARTVGHVEPSYVIRRFLDAAKIGHLATYLEQAHAPEHYGEAARDGDEAPPTTTRPELTTLLVNCYGQGRTRVIQVRFNVSVPRAPVPEKTSTLRDRSER